MCVYNVFASVEGMVIEHILPQHRGGVSMELDFHVDKLLDLLDFHLDFLYPNCMCMHNTVMSVLFRAFEHYSVRITHARPNDLIDFNTKC